MTAVIASVLVVLLVGVPAFKLGQAWERIAPSEPPLVRHAWHHHRQRSHVRRCEPTVFDQDASA